MKRSNINISVIDKNLLSIRIDDKHEHISIEDARAKYAHNKIVMDALNNTLDKLDIHNKPLELIDENEPIAKAKPSIPKGIDALRNSPLESHSNNNNTQTQKNVKSTSVSLSHLNNQPLDLTFNEDLKNSSANNTTTNLKNLNSEPLDLKDDNSFSTRPTKSLKDALKSQPLDLILDDDFDKNSVNNNSSKPKELNDAPLDIVDESKFSAIYDKHHDKIYEIFGKANDSFLDVDVVEKSDHSRDEI